MKTGLLDFYLFPLSDWRQLNDRLSGDNARHVLIVLDDEHSGEELTDFLGKILSAAKLRFREDTLLLKLTKAENISFSNLSRAKPIKYALLFGVEPRQLGLFFTLPPDQPVKHAGTYFLRTSTLAELFEERKSESRSRAAALWQNLKQLFIDK